MKENIHLTHIKLKPTKKIEIGFNPKDLRDDIEVPKSSLEIVNRVSKSKQYSDEFDILLMFENNITYAFDYLFEGEKILIPEINPATIFYSNAVMSHRKIIEYKQKLLENSPTINNYQKNLINPSLFVNFFQIASNCIFNLQSTLESFVNYLIPQNYEFIDAKGDKFSPSIFHKIDRVLPRIKNINFKSKFKKDNIQIRKLIELRNELIHLNPKDKDTNTQYKKTYRKLLDFDYSKSIFSIRKFVNFYEPKLIEECECEKEFYFDIKTISKCKHLNKS